MTLTPVNMNFSQPTKQTHVMITLLTAVMSVKPALGLEPMISDYESAALPISSQMRIVAKLVKRSTYYYQIMCYLMSIRDSVLYANKVALVCFSVQWG